MRLSQLGRRTRHVSSRLQCTLRQDSPIVVKRVGSTQAQSPERNDNHPCHSNWKPTGHALRTTGRI